MRFSPYAAPLFVGSAALLLVTRMAWQRRGAQGAFYLFLVSLATIAYALGYAWELSSETLGQVRFWLGIEYVGASAISALYLLLTLSFLGYQRYLFPLSVAALLFLPALTIIFAWTNTQHDLIWQNLAIASSGSYTQTRFDPGAWYWVHTAFSIATTAASLTLLLAAWTRNTGLICRQIGLLALAQGVAVAFYIAYLSRFGPTRLDLTPYGMIVGGAIAAVALFNYQLFEVLPIAREVVLRSMTDAMIVVDERQRVIELNMAAQNLLAPDALARDLADVVPDRLAALPDCLTSSVTQADIGDTAQVFEAHITPLYARAHQFAGHLITLRDITSRKQIELERESLIRELNAFTGTVAHDLKSPLHGILGYASVLADDFESMSSAELRQYLRIIEQYTLKMNAIIEELLLLASVRRLDEINTGPLDMGLVVEGAVERLGLMIEDRHATIISPDIWPVAVGYGPWVEEVWANYISNAIKYGGTPPRVELGGEARPDGRAHFWVRDNGMGIPQDRQAQLFNEFTRLEHSRVEGHGLGLSIVRRIMNRLGGGVSVESAPGQGSVFSFWLPGVKNEKSADE